MHLAGFQAAVTQGEWDQLQQVGELWAVSQL